MKNGIMTDFAEWVGRTSEREDIVTERLVKSFRAIFEPHLAATSDDVAPPGIHWCLSPAIAAMADLGPDGHPAKNRDLPPVPQPRRMWAGGCVETFDPLRIGDQVRRVSTIADITRKEGRSGELWFVAVEHDYLTQRGTALRERHDIVYREAASGRGQSSVQSPPETPKIAARSWHVPTSATLLFRYSAITFNGHRIHYDLPYAKGVEGYEGLVVHAPIQAALLINLASRDGGVPGKFTYRAVSPMIAGNELVVCAGRNESGDDLWVQSPAGRVSMTATAGARATAAPPG